MLLLVLLLLMVMVVVHVLALVVLLSSSSSLLLLLYQVDTCHLIQPEARTQSPNNYVCFLNIVIVSLSLELLEDVSSADKSRSPKVEHLSSLVKALKWPPNVLFPGKMDQDGKKLSKSFIVALILYKCVLFFLNSFRYSTSGCAVSFHCQAVLQ